jgi:hypothetical protein
MAATRLTMKLIKATHATDVAADLAAAVEKGGEATTEAAALADLSTLRLSGLGVAAIESLEPFDNCEALYLDHNDIAVIEVQAVRQDGVLLSNLKVPGGVFFFLPAPEQNTRSHHFSKTRRRVVRRTWSAWAVGCGCCRCATTSSRPSAAWGA